MASDSNQEDLYTTPAVVIDRDYEESGISQRTTQEIQSQENREETPSSSQNTFISQADENSNDSTQSTSKKRRLEENFEEDDGMTCSICLDNWTNSGEHSICSLKCGHLFGYQCITRWLGEKKVCPTCKRKAHGHDIRFIYARRLVAVDTTEITIMKTQLQLAQEEKNKIQMELTKNICKEHTLLQKIEDLKKTVEDLTNKLAIQQQLGKRNLQTSQVNKDQIRLYKEKSLDLGKDSGCRVINAKSSLDLAVVSLKSYTNFFTGFGIRKYNVTNYKATAFIGLHSASIRDMKFHNENPWILTAAMDKTSTVVNLNNNEKVMSTICDSPIWSCCWDPDISPIFYLGTSRGVVLKYDMRNPNQQLDSLEVPGDMSPVVSVQGVKRSTNPAGEVGLLSCKLSSLWFFNYDNSSYTSYPLPIEGPFSSMTYSNSTGHMLLSARPSETFTVRHIISTLSKREEKMSCDILYTFNGGFRHTRLSRSHLLSNNGQFATAYVEDTKTVNIWNLNSGKKVGGIHVSDYVLDLSSVQSGNSNFLLALTESKLEFFKFS